MAASCSHSSGQATLLMGAFNSVPALVNSGL